MKNQKVISIILIIVSTVLIITTYINYQENKRINKRLTDLQEGR